MVAKTNTYRFEEVKRPAYNVAHSADWTLDTTSGIMLVGLWIRPYCVESTASRPISEVKLRQASLVLGWESTRESGVPYPFCCFIYFLSLFRRLSHGNEN